MQQNTPRLPIILIITAAVLAGLLVCLLASRFFPRHQAETNKPAEIAESGKQTEEQLRDYKHQVTVYLTADGPTPQTLNIPVDTRINWKNKDSVQHKLSITPGTIAAPQFDDGHLVSPGDGYPFVIHRPITFHYYVVDRPTQGGTVIVK